MEYPKALNYEMYSFIFDIKFKTTTGKIIRGRFKNPNKKEEKSIPSSVRNRPYVYIG